MNLVLASLAGVLLFLWPFLGFGLPPFAPAVALAVGTGLALALVEMGARRLDTRLLALLAALAAVDAALRMALLNGVGGFSPIFFLVLCSGFVFGPSYGFLVGSTALLVSALATGGLGPWLPYQMFATGWVGAAAGLAGRVDGHLATLALVGLLAGIGFGALMDVWDWTYFRGSPDIGWMPGMAPLEGLARFGRYYIVTSLAYDAFRAVGNLVLVLLLGRPVVATMRRMRARFTLELIPLPAVD